MDEQGYKRLAVRVPDDMAEQMSQHARALHLTRSAFLRQLYLAYCQAAEERGLSVLPLFPKAPRKGEDRRTFREGLATR